MPKARNKLPGGIVAPDSFDTATPVHRFTIPISDKNGPVLPPGWRRSDADRTFCLQELTPEREEMAARAAGTSMNFQAVFQELIRLSVYMIGDKRVRGNRDEISKWMKDVGPRGRKYVEAAFNRLTSVAEADIDAFLEGAEQVSA